MRSSLFVIASLVGLRLLAQPTAADTITVPFSEYGSTLSPHGTIRILVLFCEIDYDKNPSKDPQPNGAEHWPKGQLPRWKDDLFDAYASDRPQAMVTGYYHDVSLGGFTVLGDYVDHMFTLKESEYAELANAHSVGVAAVKEANKLGSLHTAHDLHIADFDLWQRGGKPGFPRTNKPDDPHRYDHVMVIARNSGLTHGQGSTDGGSPGQLYGYESDSQSRFGGMNDLPFEILKHEFNHLLLGGNNFHSGGGNASQFESYQICQQGGWSLMGAANSSLLTCSGWDRMRLGWYPPQAPFTINVHDPSGAIVDGDLDPLAGDTGIFVLRDFVPSGDAIRIRMPFIPRNEYQQWLWVENHQTEARNGSRTDRFHWDRPGITCVSNAVPGLYMEMQIDRENKRGKDIFGGLADYLHPLVANGHYDVVITNDTNKQACPFGGPARIYRLEDRWQNPLTGSSAQELISFDRNNDGTVERGEHTSLACGYLTDGVLYNDASFFGAARHVWRPGGNTVLAMGTNPSSANMLTLDCTGKQEKRKGAAPDNRTVYLNGIRVELLRQRDDGGIDVRVSTGDTRLTNDVRWCADSIVLPPLKGKDGRALTLATGHRLLIDRSRTATRMTLQEEVDGTRYFAPRTRFTVSTGAIMRIEAKAELQLANGSVLHVMPGAELNMDPTALLTIDASSRIVVHGTAKLTGKPKTVKKLRKKKRIVLVAD